SFTYPDLPLSFDRNIFLLRNFRFLFFLRDRQLQDTMFEFTFHIFLSYAVAYIEGSLAGSCITLFPDVSAALLILLVLIKSLSGADGQITVFQRYLNLI